MPNVLISELTQATALASTTIVMVQLAAGPPAEFANLGQVAAFVFATSIALTGQSTATIATAGTVPLASSPAGYLIFSLNGTAVKLPFYNT